MVTHIPTRPMDASIDERLTLVEEQLLLASAQGVSALTAFHDQWNSLLQDIENGVRMATVNDKTLLLANSVSSRVAVLTDCLIDFKTSADAIENHLEEVFAEINIDDNPDVVLVQSRHHAVNEHLPVHAEALTSTTHSSYPLYIEPAYQWLLKNLYNPYPSREIRVSIARDSGTDSKAIDSWFIDTRKRIGWNVLRKQYFSNKRVDIVDAATRFFIQEDEKRPLDPAVELELAALQKRAKDLYADRFAESTLAAKLDIAVKDLTPVTKAQAQKEGERRWQEARRQEEDALAASSYPSPQRSPGRSPESVGLAPLEEDEDLATTRPEAIAGRKRRSLSPDGDEESPADRPNKRTRLATPSLSTGLPSPTPSHHEPLRRSASPTLASDPIPLPTISRKRRLSDADGQGAPKRPRDFPSGPRLQTVSDPLPTSFEASSMDQWFNAHFGIPNPVVVDELDASQPLDVQVFNYSAAEMETPSLVNEPLAGEPYSPASVDNTIPQLVVDEVPLAGDTLQISTNNFDINELFTDYEEPETVFSGQDLVNHPQDMSLLMSQPSISDFSYITNFSTTTFVNSFDANFSADATHPLSLDPTSHLDWFFPPFMQSHGLVSPVDQLQDFGQNVLIQDPSLMFNNSAIEMSGLYPKSPAVQGPLAEDKAEMVRQLAAMKEAMRHLEEKLAVSS